MNALREIAYAIGRVSMWGPLAIDDVIGRYQRTVFGPLWVVLPQALFIFGIFLLHQASFGGASKDFLPYLAISLPLWAMIVGFVVEGATSMVAAKGFIESYALPPALHIVRPVARGFVTFAHLIIVYLGVELWVHHGIPMTAVAAIPALLLLAIFGLGAGLALGPLGARYRDLAPAIQAVMTLGFVLTPVFWIPTPEQKANLMVKLNPFYYLLEVVRSPLLGTWGDPKVWAVAAALAFGALIVGLVTYAARRTTVVFWL